MNDTYLEEDSSVLRDVKILLTHIKDMKEVVYGDELKNFPNEDLLRILSLIERSPSSRDAVFQFIRELYLHHLHQGKRKKNATNERSDEKAKEGDKGKRDKKKVKYSSTNELSTVASYFEKMLLKGGKSCQWNNYIIEWCLGLIDEMEAVISKRQKKKDSLDLERLMNRKLKNVPLLLIVKLLVFAIGSKQQEAIFYPHKSTSRLALQMALQSIIKHVASKTSSSFWLVAAIGAYFPQAMLQVVIQGTVDNEEVHHKFKEAVVNWKKKEMSEEFPVSSSLGFELEAAVFNYFGQKFPTETSAAVTDLVEKNLQSDTQQINMKVINGLLVMLTSSSPLFRASIGDLISSERLQQIVSTFPLSVTDDTLLLFHWMQVIVSLRLRDFGSHSYEFWQSLEELTGDTSSMNGSSDSMDIDHHPNDNYATQLLHYLFQMMEEGVFNRLYGISNSRLTSDAVEFVSNVSRYSSVIATSLLAAGSRNIQEDSNTRKLLALELSGIVREPTVAADTLFQTFLKAKEDDIVIFSHLKSVFALNQPGAFRIFINKLFEHISSFNEDTLHQIISNLNNVMELEKSENLPTVRLPFRYQYSSFPKHELLLSQVLPQYWITLFALLYSSPSNLVPLSSLLLSIPLSEDCQEAQQLHHHALKTTRYFLSLLTSTGNLQGDEKETFKIRQQLEIAKSLVLKITSISLSCTSEVVDIIFDFIFSASADLTIRTASRISTSSANVVPANLLLPPVLCVDTTL